MKKIVLSLAFSMSSFAFAQNYHADINLKDFGAIRINLELAALESTAAQTTVSRLEKIDQAVYGDWLCVNTLTFPNALAAKINLVSASEAGIIGQSAQTVALKVEDIKRSEQQVACDKADLSGEQRAYLATHGLYSEIILRQNLKSRLVLRIDFFHLNKGLTVTSAANGALTSAKITDLENGLMNKDTYVVYSLVQITKEDGLEYPVSSFLENGQAAIQK